MKQGRFVGLLAVLGLPLVSAASLFAAGPAADGRRLLAPAGGRDGLGSPAEPFPAAVAVRDPRQALGASPAPEIDPNALMAAARPVLASDLAAWAEAAFRRRVRRERLGKRGDVVWRAEYVFEVRPGAAGFDERLLEIDGRRPTQREVDEHRRAARFSKHYREAIAGELRNPLGEDLPLSPLLFDQEHRYVGEELVTGIPCYRIAFDARPEPHDAPEPERLKRAAQGALCLSVDGNHVVEAAVETVRPVRDGPLRLEHLSLRVESRPVGNAWLPRLFETRSQVRIGFQRLRKRNRYEYTDYRHP